MSWQGSFLGSFAVIPRGKEVFYTLLSIFFRNEGIPLKGISLIPVRGLYVMKIRLGS